jgi:hypothetical protein
VVFHSHSKNMPVNISIISRFLPNVFQFICRSTLCRPSDNTINKELKDVMGASNRQAHNLREEFISDLQLT